MKDEGALEIVALGFVCFFFSKKYSSFFFSLDFVLSVRLHCHSNKHCVRSQNTTYTKIARLNKIRRLYVYLSIFPSLVVCCATPWLVLKLKFYLLLYKIQIFISFLIVDVFFYIIIASLCFLFRLVVVVLVIVVVVVVVLRFFLALCVFFGAQLF